MFVDRSWPENFIFPACAICNGESRESENILGFLSRLYSAKDSLSEEAQLNKYIDTLASNYPQEMRSMMGLSVVEKRRAAKNIKLRLPPGYTHRDLPVVRLPKSWVRMVEDFGKKLTKAIHFHETGIICSHDGGVWSSFIANAAEIQSPINRDFLAKLGRTHEIQRSNKDLSDQFSYLTERTSDGASAIYVFAFNRSFKLICFYDNDGDKVAKFAEQYAQDRGLQDE
ncbi:hypothetical protein [Acidovorax sp. 56]|uniref:hypothetical protein n=1 Tax=Acidovorax sp. 56 TaxID=2035205 RepID=UPI0011784453|nr:hypothetical protein [Acidovorax sp. 56]